MAADDVASAVGRIAMGSPVNGTVEVGGPESFVSMNSSGEVWLHAMIRGRLSLTRTRVTTAWS